MKKNLYYRNVFRRKNAIKEAMLGFFYDFCSFPRLLLEVFIKRNFGKRYFSFSSAVIMTVILFFTPFSLYTAVSLIYNSNSYGFDGGKFFEYFLSWYIFLAAFMYFCLQHRKDLKSNPSVFDFAKFSLSDGQYNPVFRKLLGTTSDYDVRTREIFLEPILFFSVGLGLLILQQWIGLIIIISSIFYGFGYWGAYHEGDNFVMDRIDEMIMNEEQVNAFVKGEPSDKTRGVRFYADKPTAEELRQKVVDTFTESDDDDDVAEAR